MIHEEEAGTIVDLFRMQNKNIESLMNMYDTQITDLIEIMKGNSKQIDKYLDDMDRMSKILEYLVKDVNILKARIMELEKQLDKE